MVIDKKMRILIVDDMQAIRQAIANILRTLGFINLSYASNGKLALDVIKEMEIKLVLLDWNMPRMSGIEFLRAFRETEGYEDTPVIMVTAENNMERVHEALNVGVTSYLLKPFSPKDIQEKLSVVLGEEIEEESTKESPGLYIPS